MNINIELIDEMRKRTNCSYQEAKELLEKHNGDLIDAIVEFEKKHSHGHKHHQKQANGEKNHGFGKKVKELVQKGFITRFVIEKDNNTILNIPINVLILAVIITMPIFWLYVIAFIGIYFMGYKIRIRKEEGKDIDVNEFVDDLGSKVKSATDKMREKPAESQNANGSDKENENTTEMNQETKNPPSDKKEDDYNEITVG